MHVLGISRIVWNGEAAVTYSHLTLAKGQREETELVKQTAQGLKKESSKLLHRTSIKAMVSFSYTATLKMIKEFLLSNFPLALPFKNSIRL